MASDRMPILDELPAAFAGMGELAQWILWRPIWNEQKQKFDKLPISPVTGKVASALDPSNQRTYAAIQVAAAHWQVEIGFAFTATDNYFFVDVDNALQSDGQWSPLASQIFQMFPGCAFEISFSGKGFHIFGQYIQKLQHGNKRTDLGIELYTEGRWVALTGTAAQGSDKTSAQACYAMYASWFPRSTAAAADAKWTDKPYPKWLGPEDDDELIRRMLSSRPSDKAMFGEGATIGQLWNADEDALAKAFPDPGRDDDLQWGGNEADAALLSHLAFWTGKNAARMERMFSTSQLGQREKWNNREDYRRRSILFAIDGCTDVYQDPRETVIFEVGDEWSEWNEFSRTYGPDFPLKALHPYLRSVVESVSVFAQTPPVLAASALLGSLAVCLQRRFEIQIKPGYSETLSLYMATALVPASRKSAVLEFFSEPFHKFVCQVNKRLNFSGSSR